MTHNPETIYVEFALDSANGKEPSLNIKRWQSTPFEGGTEYNTHDSAANHLGFVAAIREALGPGSHKLMIDELPDAVRSLVRRD